jgi:hypothetical protein
MSQSERKVWTHDAYLVVDAVGNEEESAVLKVGAARLSGANFVIELVQGLSVSGRLMLKLKKSGER